MPHGGNQGFEFRHALGQSVTPRHVSGTSLHIEGMTNLVLFLLRSVFEHVGRFHVIAQLIPGVPGGPHLAFRIQVGLIGVVP